MRKYSDYKSDKTKDDLSKEDMKKVEWTRYKIVVPTEIDRRELMEAFEHFHYEGYDSDIIAANQLAHEYLDEERMEGGMNNIIVDEELFNKLNTKK